MRGHIDLGSFRMDYIGRAHHTASLRYEFDGPGFKSFGGQVYHAFHPSEVDKLVPASDGVAVLTVRLQGRRMASLTTYS
jgi:hypothetical protein